MESFRKLGRKGSRRARESGYILITLMMMCSVIVIMLAVVLPQMSQQIRRDREMELIHRGVQYSRAIRRFYKKNGRYPVRLEELENSNNIRYLRRRYKDPTTGKDFKLVHFGEVQMGMAPGIAGGVAPGANAFGSVPAPSSDSGGNFGAPGRVNTGASLNPRGALSNPSSDTSLGSSSDSSGSSAASSSNTAQSSFGNNPSSSPGASSQPGSNNPSGLSGQVFGGGPIVGVVSTSKKQSIREFNKKNHYNDWQFIYDPSTDRGGLLSTPAQPPLQGVPAQPNQQPPGVPVLTPGGQQGGFGQPGPGTTPPPSMTPQMPPDQQQAPQ